MSKIKIVWKSNNPEKKYGYLRISERLSDEGKTKITSLKLPPIHKRHWDNVKQRVKHTHQEYITYNNQIEEYINKYNVVKTTKFLPDDKKSLVFYVENYLIPNCNSVGTKQKYQNILNLIILFNKSKYNRTDILFKDIDEDFINKWRIWLRNERGIVENSISYKTRTFKSFISKSTNNRYYTYFHNPFSLIKTPIKRTDVDFLDEGQINNILYTDLFEVNRSGKNKGQKKEIDTKRHHSLSINDVRNFFLFQFFSHGLRVSDLMTLRWNNININGDEIRIRKIMLKTKNSINILIYYQPLLILFNYVPKKFISPKILEYYDFLKKMNDKYGIFFIKHKKKIDYDFLNQNIQIPIETIDPEIVKYFNNKSIDGKTTISIKECDQVINTYTKNQVNTYDLKYSTLPLRSYELNKDVVHKSEYIEKRLLKDKKLVYLIKLRQIILNKVKKKIDNNINKINDFNKNLYVEMIEIIKQINLDEEYSKSFVFPLLDDVDFTNITNEQMFERMNENQYCKLSGRRSYYNQLLKVLGKQTGIPRLTSHKSRHSYTSILVKKNKDINLYDLSVSLGHQSISTTQTYIQNFINTRIDNMGKGLSDSFGSIEGKK